MYEVYERSLHTGCHFASKPDGPHSLWTHCWMLQRNISVAVRTESPQHIRGTLLCSLQYSLKQTPWGGFTAPAVWSKLPLYLCTATWGAWSPLSTAASATRFSRIVFSDFWMLNCNAVHIKRVLRWQQLGWSRNSRRALCTGIRSTVLFVYVCLIWRRYQ